MKNYSIHKYHHFGVFKISFCFVFINLFIFVVTFIPRIKRYLTDETFVKSIEVHNVEFRTN